MGQNVTMKVNPNPSALVMLPLVLLCPLTMPPTGFALKFGWWGVAVVNMAILGHINQDKKWDTFLATYCSPVDTYIGIQAILVE